MMNETKEFPMPALLGLGSKQMLEQAKAAGLIVPLDGYKVYTYGAATSGLTPASWIAIKEFWIEYFAAAGADLVSYAGRGRCSTVNSGVAARASSMSVC